MLLSLCDHWEFTASWSDPFGRGDGTGTPVRLPHNAKNLPNHYGDHNAYQMLCGYRRWLDIPPQYAGKRLFLQFDGAAHMAEVFVNGHPVCRHNTGYTGFRAEITSVVTPGQPALVAVKLDTSENPATPPFGFVVDYLTYGGLYREVWLDVREQSYIKDVFVHVSRDKTIHADIQTEGTGLCRLSVLEEDGTLLATAEGSGSIEIPFPQGRLWSPEDPHRYVLRCQLAEDGQILDTQEVKFGIRFPEFRNDGFYLNEKKTFLRGLNRHQAYPYMGYAAPEGLQREDARILKEELGCVAVRTSHYPQSHYFIDECDRIGLLVFTEIPGWQHIGDEAWKDQAVKNTREMVLQYRNHPSIILWGVRINESGDDESLYQRTNAATRELDPTRPTSGVRFIQKSQLLEDVYAYNDFSHTGSNPGALPKKKVTGQVQKPLLISEHNGHMFPTKSFDTWSRRQEHALRHARVQDAAASSGEHCGCFGWCMFDYPTHKDFGSGDRVCYHGVMDFFRNPKLAAALYASQQENTPVLVVGSSMDIGDYPGGQIGDVSVFTNADTVALYKNGNFVTNLRYDDWKGLPNGPLRLDDTIGCLLETQEGFDKKKAARLRKSLLTIGKKGLSNLNILDLIRMGFCMLRYKMRYADAVALYGKYIGNWGGESTVWRFDGLIGGQAATSVTLSPTTALHLEVTASATTLQERQSYDMAAVRIRILDENGNIAPYAQLPVGLTLEGEAELVGPDVVTAEGGMCGTYIRTTGKPGTARLTVTTHQTEAVSITFTIL